MRRFPFALAATAMIAACAPNEADTRADAQRLEGDVRFLADDLLEGREAGTRGYDMAAHYVATRYRALGLTPGGDGDAYYQAVPLRAYGLAEPDGGLLAFSGAGAPDQLQNLVDYLVTASNSDTDVAVEAQAVFVGFGLVAEEHGRNDYDGLDVDGKIVAVLSGAPKFLNSEERAHYSSMRVQTASERGAVGFISITTPAREKRIAFERIVSIVSTSTRMEWLTENGAPYTESPNIRASAVLSLEGAEKLFASAPVQWDAIAAAAEEDAGAVAGFDLGMTARIEQQSRHGESTSANVVGVLPGNDPALKNEYVVLSAHLDHVGVRPTEDPDDDELHNGALDNASGIAAMLEVARLMTQNPPRRSVMFIALAAEEKGLVGSDYYARNPTVPAGAIVANVNLDMPIVTYDFTDIVAFGGERSTLYPVVEAAAARADLTLSPDPAPEEGSFTRSDQYSFVKTGVPAIALKPGYAKGGEEAQKAYRKDHYHRASDEPDLVNYDALRRFADVNVEIAKGIADMDERPVWKKGDFFGRTFNGPMEQ